jgi:CHAT domain-containing protein
MVAALAGLVLAAGCRREPAPLAPARRIVAAPQPPLLVLQKGEIAAGMLAGGEARSYRLTAPAGTYAGLAVEQRGIDVVLSLFAAGGRRLTRVDSPNGTSGVESLPLVMDDDPGPLRLEIHAADSAAPGRFAVVVSELRPATARDRVRVAAERVFAEGEALRSRGDDAALRSARDRYRQSLALLRSLTGAARDLGREADVLDRMGRILPKLGEAHTALASYRQALAVFRARGELEKAAAALNGQGAAYRSLGEPRRAVACYREALAFHRARAAGVPAGEGEAVTLHNLGLTFAALGAAEDALQAYGESLEVWRRLGDRGRQGQTLRNRAELFLELGDRQNAIDSFDQALPLLEAAGNRREIAKVLVGRGVAGARSGQDRQGVAFLTRALEMQRTLGDRSGELVTLGNLCLILLRLGDPRPAHAPCTRALALTEELEDRANQGPALTNLGWLQEQLTRPREAVALYERAVPLLAAAGDRGTEANALLGLARARRRLGEMDGALAAVEQALDRVESLRTEPASAELRATFFASRQQIYSLWIDLLMERHRSAPLAGYDGRALAASEQARARTLLDSLGLHRRTLGLREIQRRVLDPGTLLLEIALGEERSVLWAVSREDVTAFMLPGRAALEAPARRVHALLAAGGSSLARTQTATALADLSRLLLAPVADRLGYQRLLIVADGALFYVPFAALPDPADPRQPLLVRHEVVTLPSASSLAGLRKATAGRRPAAATLAVLADPVFDAADPRVTRRSGPAPTGAGHFSRLIFSRREAEAILALVPPAERLGALGFDASRETATSGALSRFRIVHFATHGVLDTEHPALSGMALSMVDAAGRPRDGFLRVHEIERLRLPADLVVLSACATALGREVRGEGLVGLTQAFFHAGARAVLVSLWPVDDLATADLMTAFYRELLGNRQGPAAALRAAQLSLLKRPDRSSPAFWTGFVLLGDWRLPLTNPPRRGSIRVARQKPLKGESHEKRLSVRGRPEARPRPANRGSRQRSSGPGFSHRGRRWPHGRRGKGAHGSAAAGVEVVPGVSDLSPARPGGTGR